MINLANFKHGELIKPGCMCWVGADGYARMVSCDMFASLEEMVMRNREFDEVVKAGLADDQWGMQHEVMLFVESWRFMTQYMLIDEITEYLQTDAENGNDVIERVGRRIKAEYGL
jgi:hypothetical protein